MKCRHCNNPLQHVFLDLGYAPPSNAYLDAAALGAPEVTYPLKLFVCEKCWLVQTEDYAAPGELFSKEYAYFSSTSQGWLLHAENYSKMAIDKLGLDRQSMVIEVASNDGYLLKNFVAAGIPCLGIEPTDSTATAAERLGIPVLREFFGTRTASALADKGATADLICGNNVYAHVPDINDFTEGLCIALKPDGVITLEFPHLMRLIGQNQFDTVYHEHFSYLSVLTVRSIFARAKLRIFDVEELPTHGGSVRIWGCHAADKRADNPRVQDILNREIAFGLNDVAVYDGFQDRANRVKYDFLGFLLEQKRDGKTVAAYGAAAKGNTLLNYAGVKPDLIEFVVDAAPSKQDKFLPGSHIPIYAPARISERQPDWVVILPWNIADEVMLQQAQVRHWGGRFVIAVPELKILP